MMLRNVRIKSASLHKEIFLKFSYTEVMGKNGEQTHTVASNIPVHPDLRRAFNELAPHVISLADLWQSEGRVPLEAISVIGFALSGDEAAEGVVISATRELTNLKEVAINTPLQLWDDRIAPYHQTAELSLAIEACKAEVYSYAFEDKHQPNNQGDLFADGSIITTATILEKHFF